MLYGLLLITEGASSRVGSPLLVSRSAIQEQFFHASQLKNLQRRGAQYFQIRFQGAKRMEPRKKALQADFARVRTIPSKPPNNADWHHSAAARNLPSSPVRDIL